MFKKFFVTGAGWISIAILSVYLIVQFFTGNLHVTKFGIVNENEIVLTQSASLYGIIENTYYPSDIYSGEYIKRFSINNNFSYDKKLRFINASLNEYVISVQYKVDSNWYTKNMFLFKNDTDVQNELGYAITKYLVQDAFEKKHLKYNNDFDINLIIKNANFELTHFKIPITIIKLNLNEKN